MNKVASFLFISIFFSALPSFAENTDEFQIPLDDHWDWQMRENPVWASRIGDRRWNDQWTDNSLAAIEQRHEKTQLFLQFTAY